MTQQPDTKARLQYSSRDELDIAVIGYCRGRSRYDLHARTRLALNGFYGPFAIANGDACEHEVRRQAIRSIRQLTLQILEIKEQFLPDLLMNESVGEKQIGVGWHASHQPDMKRQLHPVSRPAQRNLAQVSVSKPHEQLSEPNPKPIDEPLRQFLGDDAAIMAELNPFINDLT
ncbi:MAG: hypothetical protein ACTS2F_17555 [Thainema sp.]